MINRRNIRTRLHDAIVFKLYKPNNEKSRQNVIYRGALEWNKLNKEQRLLANYKSSGLDIKVLVLPAPGQVVLNFHLPKYKIYLPCVLKSLL